jgi:hypothetical protein
MPEPDDLDIQLFPPAVTHPQPPAVPPPQQPASVPPNAPAQMPTTNNPFFRPDARGYVLPSIPPKSPFIAMVLNWLFPGGGYLYLGQVGKGIVGISIWFFIAIPSIVLADVFSFGFGGGPVYSLWCLCFILPIWVDTYLVGRKLERGLAVRDWEIFSRLFSR